MFYINVLLSLYIACQWRDLGEVFRWYTTWGKIYDNNYQVHRPEWKTEQVPENGCTAGSC